MSSLKGRSLGILGGMGPLATAQFIRTIYEYHLDPVEQSLPRLLADSDPGLLPDRTRAIRDRDEDHCAALIEERLRLLSRMGATRTVLPCMTAHHFLDRVDPPVRAGVISLASVAVRALSSARGPVVMLATSGTREARVLERTPGWPGVADRVILPGPADQELIHRLVYRIKQLQVTTPDVADVTDQLCDRYGGEGVLLACTEFHLHSPGLAVRYGPAQVVDPLRSIAADLPEYLGAAIPAKEITRC